MKGQIILHPFLLACFPVLFLYTYSLQMTPFHEIVRSAIIVLSLTLSLWLITLRYVQSPLKSGLIVSLFLFLFITYGYVLVVTSPAGQFPNWGGHSRHVGVQLLLVVLFMGGSRLITRANRKLIKATNLANFASACLVAFNLVAETIDLASAETRMPPLDSASRPEAMPKPSRPSIYYIILDEYGREDMLRDFFQMDNSAFVDHLTQDGFYVARSSRANYCNTLQSLASSLNFSYLDRLVTYVGSESSNRHPLGRMIRDNQVARFLRNQGYEFVAFSSGISLTEMDEADIYLKPFWALNQFEYTLLLTCPMGQLSPLLQFQNELHRQRLNYTFAHLADFAKSKTPVFVFAHILAPHSPFVFGEHGERVNGSSDRSIETGFRFYGERETYVRNYRAQLCYVDAQIQKSIDSILAHSLEPPVIILQSDHGSGSNFDRENLANSNLQERMSILNAYYFPGKGAARLYPTITPVNTFRILFDEYFGTRLHQLEDRSYFETWSHPYHFIDISDRLNSVRGPETTATKAQVMN